MTRSGGGLWVGKRYAKAGAIHRDPLKSISHGASVTQVCRFYYLLATGRLINPQRSLEMLKIMSDPGIHHKFVHSLEEVAPTATLYRKSGTWQRWHADSVLVWGKQWRRLDIIKTMLLLCSQIHADASLGYASFMPRLCWCVGGGVGQFANVKLSCIWCW